VAPSRPCSSPLQSAKRIVRRGSAPSALDDARRLHHRDRAVCVVGRAVGRVPRVEVAANQHHLVAQRGVAPRDLRNHVVAVPIVLVIARPELDAQRDGMAPGRQPRERVYCSPATTIVGTASEGFPRLPVTPTVPSRYALGLTATAGTSAPEEAASTR
jgi:hypothetical protein